MNTTNRELGGGAYEVDLIINASATIGEQQAFIVECVYSGVTVLGTEIIANPQLLEAAWWSKHRGCCSPLHARLSLMRPRTAAIHRCCCTPSTSMHCCSRRKRHRPKTQVARPSTDPVHLKTLIGKRHSLAGAVFLWRYSARWQGSDNFACEQRLNRFASGANCCYRGCHSGTQPHLPCLPKMEQQP